MKARIFRTKEAAEKAAASVNKYFQEKGDTHKSSIVAVKSGYAVKSEKGIITFYTLESDIQDLLEKELELIN